MNTESDIFFLAELNGVEYQSEDRELREILDERLKRESSGGPTDLVRTVEVVGPSPDDEELARTAGGGWGADCLLHGGHLSPAVGEGVVALHTTQATLPVIASYSIHL